MNKNVLFYLRKRVIILILITLSSASFAQDSAQVVNKSEFWNKVQYGGGFGLGFGSGFTNVALSPQAIYNANKYISLGVGVQYSFLKQKNIYSSKMYGGSLIALFNPIQEIQLSAEVEQLRVNVNYQGLSSNSDNFWNTGLFVGAGYRMENVTFGLRYNLLYENDKGVYGDALIPFVRLFF